MKIKSTLITLLSLACFAGERFANAGTHVWSGAQNGFWSNPANWSSGGAPSALEAPPVIVQFAHDQTSRRQSTNNIANLKLEVLAFFGGDYELYGNGSTLTLIGGQPPFPYAANFLSGGSAVNYMDWRVNLVLSNDVRLLVGSAATLELCATISGPGGLTKTGPGTLKFGDELHASRSGDNTFEGAVKVLDGLVVAQAFGYDGILDPNVHLLVSIPSALIIGDTNMARSPKVQLKYEDQLGATALTINPNGLLELVERASVTSLTMTGGKVQFTPKPYYDVYVQDWRTNYTSLFCGTNVTSYPTDLSTAMIEGQGDLYIYTSYLGEPSFINIVGGTMIMDANIRGWTTLNKLGAGELLWNGDDSFKGDFLIREGVLAVTGTTPFYKSSAYSITVSNGAQLSVRDACTSSALIRLNGFGIGGTNGALVVEKNGATFAASLQFDSDSAIVVTNPLDGFTVNGGFVGGVRQHFQGPGNLFKKGPGTLLITGDQTNSMTGTFFVEQGKLILNTADGVTSVSGPLVIGDNINPLGDAVVRILRARQIATNAPVTILNSGELDMNTAANVSQTIGSLAGTGLIKLGSSTLTVGVNNLDTSYVGYFTGDAASSLVKVGTGKWTMPLRYSLNFLGSTKINKGTIDSSAYMPSTTVTVNPGATLMGDGTFGNVSSVGGTIHHSQLSPQPMQLKSLVLDPATTFRVDFVGPYPNGLSRLNVGGTVNLGGAKLEVALKYPSTVGTKFQIITNDGVDPVIGHFKDILEGETFVRGTALYRMTYQGGTGNDVVLTHTDNVAPPHIGSIEPLANGEMHIIGTGFPGVTYTLDASTDLKTWTTIAIVKATSPDGKLVYSDPDAPMFPHRFYRFVAP